MAGRLPFDQDSGARALTAHAESQVGDDELREAREPWPDAGIVWKEMLVGPATSVSIRERSRGAGTAGPLSADLI